MAQVAMHYEGNFNSERGQVEEIAKTVTEELGKMKETLGDLGWSDEKSAQFIAEAEALIEEINAKKAEAVSGANEILSEVEKALNIYEG